MALIRPFATADAPAVAARIERCLREVNRHDHMETGASITAHEFYRRLGYIDVRSTDTEFGFNYILRRDLP